MTKRAGMVVRYIGTADVYYIDEADWRHNQGITADKGVPKRMVWHAGNGWTWPVRDPDTEELLDEVIMDYFAHAVEFVVVEEGNLLHIPFIRARQRTVQFSALQLGRAVADNVSPEQAARHLSAEQPIVHTGPADVEGVTDTRDEGPPTGRIPGNEATPDDATARTGGAGGARVGDTSPVTTVGGSTRTSSTAGEK
jgi:hypothetical protein